MDSIGLIRDFLKDRLGVEPDTVVPEAPLADLGVDSLMMLELMFEFEDRFNIKLSSDLKTPQTVGEMVALMDGLIASQRAREPVKRSFTPAPRAQASPFGVANARHSQSHGCAWRLDRAHLNTVLGRAQTIHRL